MAPISLGIHASSSSNEGLLCIPANVGREVRFWFEENTGFIVEYPHQLRANHRPHRMELTKLNALPYRSTRYQHEQDSHRHNASGSTNRCAFAGLWAMRVPNRDLRKSLRKWHEYQTVRSGVDRMWALQRFRSVGRRVSGETPGIGGKGSYGLSNLCFREWRWVRHLHRVLEASIRSKRCLRSTRRNCRAEGSTSQQEMSTLETWPRYSRRSRGARVSHSVVHLS